MTAVFVTATGTEIGKTHVSCALLEEARRRGLAPRPFKPLMSGFDPERLALSDAGRLLEAAGRQVSPEAIDLVCLHAFVPPLAPNVAARDAGVMLDESLIEMFLADALAGDTSSALTLIEGAGGVLSPLTDRMLNADLMARLPIPALLVTASYLGAVSHTLTALEALERRAVNVIGVIVSQPAASAGAPDSLIGELGRWTRIPLFAAPFGTGFDAGAVLSRLTPH